MKPTTVYDRRNHLKVTEPQIYTSDEKGVLNVIRCVPAHTFGRRTKLIIITLTLMLHQPSFADFLHKGRGRNTTHVRCGMSKANIHRLKTWSWMGAWEHDSTYPRRDEKSLSIFPRSCLHLATPTSRHVEEAPILPHILEENRKWTR